MCHHHWLDVGFEGSGQVDIEQSTGFLQNVMKHLDHDTKQRHIWGSETLLGHLVYLHNKQGPNETSKAVPQVKKAYLKQPGAALLQCAHTS